MIAGTVHDDRISGDDRHNALSGHDSNDILRGRNGNDWISGGHGNDTIHGGAGNDRLIGGLGSDVLVFEREWHISGKNGVKAYFSDGHDEIYDFSEIDIIDLSGHHYANDFRYLLKRAEQLDTTVRLVLSDVQEDVIDLLNTNIDDLYAGQFVF